ncbi:hypothetical protein ATK17_1215 [Branchiibius hedensis]|uniref:Uncharacterized protein n=1 Tax=Branchiibius hedensis TaxID=672460 RepID=A0A2Y8ZRE9_9MICO|nr:hypothetical protein [Branchiibius hedensis]PWJ25103.1 hypothetical protein ATK17_1215 [Branchiibius hedensis]SSA33918.1 hypothetical protein SAMN04489750_1215 [Branchiibius hedensis]
MTDRMQPFEVANALRSHDHDWYRRLDARLHWFSFCVPRPKESEPDRLAIAFRLDHAPVEELASLLNVSAGNFMVQTPQAGPLAGIELSSDTSRMTFDSADDLQPWPLLTVTLWNPRDMWHVDDQLVEAAAQAEQALDLLPLQRWPLETRLLGWLTPARHPELFTAT